MAAATIADLIRQGRRITLAGRDAELGLVRQVTAPGGPVVVYVHGPAGIGKTALISALDACLEDEGVRRLHIAAGAVEPTPTAILMALGGVLDHKAGTVAELAAALASSKDVTVVMIDDVDTWRLEDDAAREEVLDRLEELVIKPVDGSGGKGIVIGPRATKAELDALRDRVREDPRSWIAQPVVQLSTVPTLIEDGLKPRHVDLRPFAVNNGEDIWVLPGGLTRVALPEGELVVNSSQGGGSKDTWVLSPPPHRSASHRGATEHTDDADDHVPPPHRVPLTVAKIPMTVMPKFAETQQQEQDQQQQQGQQQASRRRRGC